MNEGFRYQICIDAKLSRHIVAAKRQKILMYIKGVKIKQGFRTFLQILAIYIPSLVHPKLTDSRLSALYRLL